MNAHLRKQVKHANLYIHMIHEPQGTLQTTDLHVAVQDRILLRFGILRQPTDNLIFFPSTTGKSLDFPINTFRVDGGKCLLQHYRVLSAGKGSISGWQNTMITACGYSSWQ